VKDDTPSVGALLVRLRLSNIFIFNERIESMKKLFGKFCGVLWSVVRFLCLLWIRSEFFKAMGEGQQR
jgi:hypothetical protein